MYSYISGKITFKSPASIVVDNGGIGYEINISLHTYSSIQDKDECLLYTFFHVKEDAQTLYGFADKTEKQVFIDLISVSGIGPNTARMILSSFPPEEFRQAIVTENEDLIRSIKGVGPKSAKRMILELKDKMSKDYESAALSAPSDNTHRQEALSALIMLGFSKMVADKAVRKVLKDSPNLDSVEEVIKQSLKNM